LAFTLHDEEVADGIGDQLRNTHYQSVDENVELELIQHKGRRIELEDDGALKDDQHDGHSSKGLEFEQIQDRKPSLLLLRSA
jgi:hypothetical protein